MKNLVSRFVKDESGATAIEYGLIAAGIAIAIITAVNGVGSQAVEQLRHDLDLAEVSDVANARTSKAPACRGLYCFAGATEPTRCPRRSLDRAASGVSRLFISRG